MKRERIRIRRGLDLPLAGPPSSDIENGNPISKVALLGPDYDGLKPSMAVSEGDRVRLGQVLFTDRRNPRVLFTSPGSGTVQAIHRGQRRMLQAVIITLDGDDTETFDRHEPEAVSGLGRDAVVEQLLASGLWTALRQRPYARIPDPDADPPAAIFVTTMDSNPLAAPVNPVLEAHGEDFVLGLRVLSRLTDGPLHIGCAPGCALPEIDIDAVRVTEFEGPHPAGLAGTHIHFLFPASAHRHVWYLHLQDCVAIGKLFRSGEIWTDRLISLAGPMIERPRLLWTRLGASLSDLVRGELKQGPVRVVSGSVLDGHHATRWAAYLGRYERQVTAIQEGDKRRFLGWLTPGLDRYSAIRAYAGSLMPGGDHALTSSQNGSARAMVPIGNFEKVMPLDILPAPLLKSLIVRDTDSAQALGCLELDQEDLALCSFVCPSKYDYGAYLRASLNQIEKEG